MEKNVLVISNMYPSRRSKTYGIFVKNQVESLRELNVEIDVAAITDPRIGKFFVLWKHFLWLIQVMAILIFKGKKYDIVHAHYVFPSGLFGLFFKKLYGTKLIVTSHGGDIDKMSQKGPFFFKQTKNILNKAEYVISVGEGLKRQICETFQIEESKVKVINMGVNRNNFSPENKKLAKKTLNLTSEKFYVLYVGNYIEAKGLLELLDAYKLLKEKYDFLELHLIGSTKQETLRNQLDDKIHNEHIKDVVIHQAKDQKEVAKWMAAADLFVLPSHMEGFGLVALEAMSSHTPVVGSDVGGLSYLLNSGAGILIEPKNINSLRDGMEKVISNKDTREQLVLEGEKKAQENDQSKLLNKLLLVYKD